MTTETDYTNSLIIEQVMSQSPAEAKMEKKTTESEAKEENGVEEEMEEAEEEDSESEPSSHLPFAPPSSSEVWSREFQLPSSCSLICNH